MNTTKLSWLIIFLVGLLLSYVESVNSQERLRFVYIEVVNYFENDRVVITLDTLTVVDKIMSTNPSISLAWYSNLLKLSKGQHRISVELPSMDIKSNLDVENIHDTTTIVVLLNRSEKKLHIGQYKYFMNVRD
jgi:hypothetical protein